VAEPEIADRVDIAGRPGEHEEHEVASCRRYPRLARVVVHGVPSVARAGLATTQAGRGSSDGCAILTATVFSGPWRAGAIAEGASRIGQLESGPRGSPLRAAVEEHERPFPRRAGGRSTGAPVWPGRRRGSGPPSRPDRAPVPRLGAAMGLSPPPATRAARDRADRRGDGAGAAREQKSRIEPQTRCSGHPRVDEELDGDDPCRASARGEP